MAVAIRGSLTAQQSNLDEYANILGNIFQKTYARYINNKEEVTDIDIVGNGINIFWTDMTQLMIQNPTFLPEVIDQFLVVLDQPLSRLFFWTKVESARDRHKLFVRIHLDEYVANPGVRKTTSRIHGLWQEITTTEVKNAGKDITLDWYFLNAPGGAGLKELVLKIQQVNSDINSAVMQHIANQIMKAELFFKDRNQMPWRISGVDTVDKAMLERGARVGASNKRQTGYYESYERANRALSHRNGPGAKVLIATNSTLFNIVHRNPKMITYQAKGDKGVADRYSYKIESTFQGLSLNSFPQTQKNLHNSFDKSNYAHERSFGSKFIFPDYSRDLQHPKDYRSWMRRVDVVGSDNNDWNGFTIPEVIEKTEFFHTKQGHSSYGQLDEKVLEQYIKAYSKSPQDTDSIWAERKLEKTTYNLRQTNPFLVFTAAGEHKIARCFGDITQLQIAEEEWDVIFQIFSQRIFHDGHFTQRELQHIKRELEDKVENDPNEFFKTKIDNGSKLYSRLRNRLQELTVTIDDMGKDDEDMTVDEVEKDGKYSSSNYAARYALANGLEDPLIAFAACQFLRSVFHLDTFNRMWDGNVLFPIGCMLARPLEKHPTEHLLYTNGLPLGEVEWDGIKTSNMYDPVYKQFHASFKTDFSTTVVNYENLYLDDAIRITGTISGKNSGIFDMRSTTSKQETNVYKRIAENESWLPFLGCYRECIGKAFEDKQSVTVNLTGVHDPAVWMQELPQSSPSFQTTYARRQFVGQDTLYFKNIFKPKPHSVNQNTSLLELLTYKNESLYCNETTIRHFNPKYNAWIIRPGCHELGLQLPNCRRVDAGLVTLDVIQARDDYIRTHKIARYS